jgi:uncharacterized coiled-coil DUF342 family protein
MNIHRKMCISLSVIFFLSIIAFYIVRSAHPTVSNILIAILTGAFLAIYTALVNYLHEREEFFNNLFLTGLFINSNFEQIKQLIANLSENSNLKYASKAIQNYANTINNITMNINFAQYTPFYNNSKEARMVERIQAIYHLTQKLIVLTSNNMEISNLEAEILVSKLNSKIPPCVSCIIPTEQRTSHAQCNAYIEYQKTINELTDKLKQQNIKTINWINTIYQNTISLQTEYLDIMKCLHCRTKNKTNWEEIIKTNKENITKTMQSYIEDAINK